jgi:cyclopropane-fatty-acyl-phospholipid synthase
LAARREDARRGRRGEAGALTADVNALQLERRFDRIVSVEMFEHAKNYEALLRRIASTLEPKGLVFVHVFAHRRYAYHYEDAWMARHFFTAGAMPSDALLTRFQEDVSLVEQWRLPCAHYAKTAEAWRTNLDERREAALPIIRGVYGRGRDRTWLAFWRVFFMACAELFGSAAAGSGSSPITSSRAADATC